MGTGGREPGRIRAGGKREEAERDAGVMQGREVGENEHEVFNDFLVCF